MNENSTVMEKRFNILIIGECYFFPPTDGITLRYYNLFKSLSPNYRMDLLAFGNSELLDNLDKLSKQLGPCFEEVEIVPADTLLRMNSLRGLRKIKNLLFPSLLSMGEPYYSETMKIRINEKIRLKKYDLIFFCNFEMIRYFDDRFVNLPHIIDAIDSASFLMKSFLDNEKQLKKKLFSFVNYLWAKRYERIHLSKVKNIIFVSKLDSNYARKNCPHSKIWILDNGVDTDYFSPSNDQMIRNKSLLFTGVMDYPPNHDSIVYFLRKILPLIQTVIPDVNLIIAGKNPNAELHSLAKENPSVTLTGFVKDIRPYFNESTIYIAPIISGAGIKNKVLEAWAMAKPVVATSMSCAGLKAIDGKNCLIANTPQIFAQKVIKLFANQALRNKLAENGRSTAEEFYSWKNRALLLEKIFTQVINK